MISEIVRRIKFWNGSDRIGPDMLSTHWRLYFHSTMKILCDKKFNKFGSNAQFRPGAHAVTCSKIDIGANVVIRPVTHLFADPRDGGGKIIIEDDVLIGGGVHLYTVNHAYSNSQLPIIHQGFSDPSLENSIVIKRGAWIGANAIILSGVVVGENSVIGAGSIVTKSIPSRVVAVGNPAKIIKQL
jgi:acetyltransferase-like isoleucine patch superfamily enzyme